MGKKLLIVLFSLVLLCGAVFAEEAKDVAAQSEVAIVENSGSEGGEKIALSAGSEADAEAGVGTDTEYEICRHFITVNANPYAFQHVGLRNKDTFNSKYGFGVNAGYRYSFGLFNAGLEVGYNNFKYEDYDRYHILSFTALGGISYYFTPKFFGDFDLGCGLDIRFMSDETRANFTTLARLNAGYWLSDLIAITGGADLKLSWQHHEVKDLRSTDLGVYVNVGTKISL